MHSLYHALLIQHSRQLTSVRCADQIIAQLHRYFEDVILENDLAALVIESLPLMKKRSLSDVARVREVGRTAKRSFFFVSPRDALNELPLRMTDQDREPILIRQAEPNEVEERFVVIADARFSVLLASIPGVDKDGLQSGGDEVIWSFEPDIVYSALEYLMARVTAEHPYQATVFASAVKSSMPKATSLQFTVSVTTKLARLLQEQAAREIAINRIATAIRNSIKISDILQTTVNELGSALNTQYCALRIDGDSGSKALTNVYCRDGEDDEIDSEEFKSDLDAYGVRLAKSQNSVVVDGSGNAETRLQGMHPVAAVPLIYQERLLGTLLVRSDDATRIWQENELLLLRTVADQVTIAVIHARLFAQALTDGLTGCYNRRSFELQLEKDLQLATRTRQPLSLIMLDVDHFKRVNDNFGHDTGDVALQLLADALREGLRGADTAARYGGEEFTIILPQADAAGAFIAAERLRMRIEAMEIPQVGHLTISLGVATFPLQASSRASLVMAADQALYEAKRAGRNRVCSPPNSPPIPEDIIELQELAEESAPVMTNLIQVY